MLKRSMHACLILTVVMSGLNPFFALAEEFKDFAELDLEALLNTEVISASKRPQKLYEAPNAIYVITGEDIEHSGAVDLPDLFRMVPGVDVVNFYGNCYSVSSRGFNDRFASKMLIMIDGRSIYTTFFGGVFWEDEKVFLEDIKQIEVIRGPGATMWGANSVNGVINIITKDPEDDQGLMIASKAGTKHFREGAIRYSDNLSDKLSFSITGGYREDEGTRGVHDFRRVPKVTGRFKYRFSDNSVLHFFAGVNESDSGVDLSMYTPRKDVYLRSNYQMLRWEHQFSDTSQFHLQVYRSSFVAHSNDKSVDIEEDKHDVEIQHSFALGKKNHIVWGANYRTTEIDSNFLYPKTDHDDIIGFFLQDEIKIIDNLSFIAGIKYEENSFTGGDWSPRGCILYSPWDNHHFRFSVSRAFTTPSFAADSFRQVETLPPPLPPLPILFKIGNEHLDPERMTAFELGYRTILFHKVGINVELYYNEIDDVVDNAILRQTLPVLVSWENKFNAIAKGIEVAADFPVAHWWTLTANYTFQEVEQKPANNDVQGTPKHKFNLDSRFTFKNGFSLDVRAHFVDETRWGRLIKDAKIDDYLRIDIRVSQTLFNDRVVLSLTGQNLTDKRHPEYSDDVIAYETERLIYAQVMLKFY